MSPLQPQRSLYLRLFKTGTDDLLVNELKIKTTQGDFLCGNFHMKSGRKDAAQSCETSVSKWWDEEEGNVGQKKKK